jgi:tetratricopeptide (TPR) repeat protein
MHQPHTLIGRAVVIAAICTVVDAHAVIGSPRSRELTAQGFELAYALEFDEARRVFGEAGRADASDPAPRRATAAVTWLEILFAQGVATFESFTGEISKADVPRPPAPAALVERFHTALAEAAQLAASPPPHVRAADALYEVAATTALSALYAATVEGRTLGAFGPARRAVHAMEQVRRLEPSRREAALLIGMSQYTVSTMPWPVRTLARASGLSGNREAGIRLLEEASAVGAATRTDALLVLVVIDVREGRYAEARRRAGLLRAMYPGNRLLAMNHGVAALLAGEAGEAHDAFTGGIRMFEASPTPTVLREKSQWLLNRGTALARLDRTSEAASVLEQGLAAQPREWVRGRIHAELGELAERRGEHGPARNHYALAIQFSQGGGDQATAKGTRRRLAGTAHK